MVHIQQSRQMDTPFDDRFQANGPRPREGPAPHIQGKICFTSWRRTTANLACQ